MPSQKLVMNESARSRTHVVVRNEEGYRFRVRFDHGRGPDLVTDEPPPLGSGDAPDPSALLAAAVRTCLASSLLFCMRKARLEVKDLEVGVAVTTGRSPEGRLRIQGIDVTLLPTVTPETRDRMGRCLGLYRSFCTVTESVRRGIPVEVALALRVVGATEVVAPPADGTGSA